MKKTFMKLACMLLMVAIALSCAACGPTPGKRTSENENYEANLTVDSNISTTLKIGFYGKTEEDENHFKELEKAFQLIYPNVSISLVTYGSTSYYQDLMQAYRTGSMPDIIQTNATECFPLIEGGLLLDMDKYIQLENDKYEQGKNEYPDFYAFENFEDQFYDSLWKLGQKNYNGHQFFVPRSADRIVTYYNKEQFVAAGVDMTTVKNGWTWEDFLAACEKLKKYYADNYDGKPFISGQWQWEAVLFPMLESSGGKVFDENGNITLNSAETLNAVNLLKDLVTKGYTKEKEPNQLAFETKTAAIQFHSLHPDYYLKSLGSDLGIVTFPLIGKGSGENKDYSGAKIGAGVTGYGIYSGLTGAKRDLAWQFLSFTLSRDGQNCMAKGGVSQPPVRKDMQDGSNLWRQNKGNLNLDAFFWEAERNYSTNFFLSQESSKQVDLMEAVINMFNEPIRGTGKEPQKAIEDCVTALDNIIKSN
ncbi:MAG: extracellular solute-binding protein [Clostridia bacterium]|nr:extracellular solute-binding protein [Clostridia bacterium]MBQ9482171.1 extracellular solute-binding protein [Clostridia bacterium]